ncbi:Dyp-type peroxidase [Nocardioides sp. YIM 152588]|uniref:Dyp-type peroxidase n=1 Tax=Nocardioides sp. YIM 152588 TaxID=3158259 RepID=UPI0032E3BD12
MPGGPRWGRRSVLRSGAAAFGGAGVGWSASALLPDDATAAEAEVVTVAPPAGSETAAEPGRHQAGVTTPPQAHLSMVGWDLRARRSRESLRRMMRLLTDDARRLAEGRAALADTEPELAQYPSRLTVTFGFGPRVMRELATVDVGLAELPEFAGDRLDEAWGQTDVVAQICSDDPVTLAHARRMLLKDARGFAEVRWIQDGFRDARGTAPAGATMRNLMGQVDGTVNPDPAEPDFDGLIWSGGEGEAAEAFAGGTFLVLRRIRMDLEGWDRVDRRGREEVIGRRLDNGAPLTGEHETDAPDLNAKTAFGFPVIDPASHMARARSSDPLQRFLRRPFNYTVPDTSRPTGEDAGLVFIAYAADVARQFVPVQRRLAEMDRLNEWTRAIGSAVYAIPPAATDDGYVGEPLLGADA